MPEITLEGKVYHAGIARDPVVILSVFDEGPFEDWCRENSIFTQIFRHRDPESGNERAVVYVTESAIAGLRDGTPVRVTIDVRPEARGNGVRVMAVTPQRA